MLKFLTAKLEQRRATRKLARQQSLRVEVSRLTEKAHSGLWTYEQLLGATTNTSEVTDCRNTHGRLLSILNLDEDIVPDNDLAKLMEIGDGKPNEHEELWLVSDNPRRVLDCFDSKATTVHVDFSAVRQRATQIFEQRRKQE